VKFLLSLPFILFPFIAVAEATGGYSYGFGDDIIGIVVVVVIVVVAFFIIRRRK